MLERSQVHVCAYAWPVTPLLLPVLDPLFRPKELWLLVEPDQQVAVAGFASTLRQHGVSVRYITLTDAEDIEAIAEAIESALAGFEHLDIALNASAGSAAVLVAALDVFRRQGLPVFYLRSDSAEVQQVPVKGEPVVLADALKLASMLSAHGYKLRPGVDLLFREASSIARDWAYAAAEQLPALQALAYYAREAQGGQASLRISDRDSPVLRQLVAPLIAAGQLQWAGGRVVFASEAARLFVDHGWISVYWREQIEALRLRAMVQDIQLNADIENVEGKRYTIDGLLLTQGHLLLAEARPAVVRHPEDPPVDYGRYRFDLVRAVAGLPMQRQLLVLGALNAVDQQRAQDCDCQLFNLQHAKDWLQQLAGLLNLDEEDDPVYAF